jgi:glycosyltransferase involved in cell wall biosynthesis
MIVWCTDAPDFGGAEIALVRAIKMSRARPCIVLHSREASPKLIALLRSEGVEAIAIFSGKNSVRCALASIRIAYRAVSMYRSATFVVWCHHIDSNRWMQFILALFQKQFIIAERIIPADWSVFDKSRLSRPLKRFAAKRARTVVLNAFSVRYSYSQFFRLPVSQVRVIPNSRPMGAIVSRYAALKEERMEILRSFGIGENSTVIVCVGRLHRQKDQGTLIDAYRRLRLQYHNLALVLVGEGEDRAYLERTISDNGIRDVYLVGYQNDVLRLLVMSDLFVLPSLFEGLSGALLEAIAVGIPCIVSEIPGNVELIRHKVTGLTFHPRDADSLAEQLKYAVENPDVVRDLAIEARAFVASIYDERQEGESWRSLLGETFPS